MNIDSLLDRLISESQLMLEAIGRGEWETLFELEKERRTAFAILMSCSDEGLIGADTSKIQSLAQLEQQILASCKNEHRHCQSALVELNRNTRATNTYRNYNSL